MIEALLQAERLLLHGMVDDAERIYAGAVEQDPLNAIAVVGLARVALERGDDRIAYAHARRALEIDPQNAAAERLETRLAEVLAARASGAAPAADATPATDATQPEPQAPPVGVRPSEQTVFTRNPSMAEHQQMEEVRDVPRASPPGSRDFPPAPPAPVRPSARRRGLIRRLFGE